MIKSLLWVLWYNGYKEEIRALYEYIKNNDGIIIQYPDRLLSDDCNKPDRILWSVLVMEYGDYGTSPRYGWIENKQKAVEEFERFFSDFGEDGAE